MNSAPPLLDVQGLSAVFETAQGTVHAVNDVSFSVQEGETVGIVGETGCGKSATVRALIGLLRPPGRVVAGSVSLDGTELLHQSRRRLRAVRGSEIGFVPQNPFGALNPILRIERQFRNVIQAHQSASTAECRDMTLNMLADVGIADPRRIIHGYAHELSGGMAQRVVIAIALVLNPRLVIADEPTTGLDLTIQRQILDLIKEQIAERAQRSMILVTHDVSVVAQYCARVIVMYAGQVVEFGPVRSVFKRPVHPYTEGLLAAIPRRDHPLVGLPGTVPTLIDVTPGCAFYDRCSYRFDPLCATERPVLREVEPGHWAATRYDRATSGTGD